MSAIGDILQALPVSHALREAFPNAEITWVVEKAFAPLLTGNPCIDEIFTMPKARGRATLAFANQREYLGRLAELRRRGFDVTLDLQGLAKSAVLAAATGAKVRIGYNWLREGAGLVEYAVPLRAESVHLVEQYLDVARWLGANPMEVRFPFHIPDADEEIADSLSREAGITGESPFVSVNPAAGNLRKQWGEENYAALMDAISEELGAPAALVTADREVAERVGALTKRPFANLAGRTSLKQLAAVLRRSAAHVCGDTGSGHLAAALGTKVVSLYGPTDPDRSCPYGQRENVLSRPSECGAGCDRRHCEFARARCLTAVPVSDVVESVQAVIEGKNHPLR